MTIAIIGGGAAGLMAAVHAARSGAKVIVLERNRAAGRKLLLTGGGRCNLTHQADLPTLISRYGRYSRFLRYALHSFSPQAVMAFFEQIGVPCQIEPDGCVFTRSGRAADVVEALTDAAQTGGAEFLFGCSVQIIQKEQTGFCIQTDRQPIFAQRVIIAAGGASYPQTGSRGEGIQWAAALGHPVKPFIPCVCPVVFQPAWVGTLQGLSLDDIALTCRLDNKRLTCRGAAVVTDSGLGGPAAMDFSWHIADIAAAGGTIPTTADWLAAWSAETLHQRLIDRCAAHPKRQVKSIVSELLPAALAEALCHTAGCGQTIANQFSQAQRRALVEAIKSSRLTAVGLSPLAKATISRGGVTTEAIDPQTMQSRCCDGLYFAGEVIDLDGPCGGYNLQIAWSTGALAGLSAARAEQPKH